jgi:acetylornithine/succinyldiaminopimelate/putrescine aminotransferase
MMKPHIAEALKPGMHGSTFGANPVACHTALAVVQKMITENIAEQANKAGEALTHGLRILQTKHKDIKEVRGSGLLIGIEFEDKVDGIVTACREKGMLIGSAGEKVLRCAPPLVIEQSHIDEALHILDEVLVARGI